MSKNRKRTRRKIFLFRQRNGKNFVPEHPFSINSNHYLRTIILRIIMDMTWSGQRTVETYFFYFPFHGNRFPHKNPSISLSILLVTFFCLIIGVTSFRSWFVEKMEKFHEIINNFAWFAFLCLYPKHVCFISQNKL